MGIIFGKKKLASRVTDQDKVILQLKNQRDKLKMYQKRIQGNLEKDRLLARKLLQDGKKDRAKLLLRKKKYQEQLLANADNQLDNIERLAQDLEYATIEIEVINGLKQDVVITCQNNYKTLTETAAGPIVDPCGTLQQTNTLHEQIVGNEALKRVNDTINIGDIERILDETREGAEKQREIDAMLSGVLTSEDEDAVEAELQRIIEDSLPSVPEDRITTEDQIVSQEKDKKKKRVEEEVMIVEA